MSSNVILLAGNPNVGKSTLFNALTGARQKIANYPGATVERKEGLLRLPNGDDITLVDLPGIYSLNAVSEDEVVAAKAIRGEMPGLADASGIFVLVEAATIDRGLLLFHQIKDLHKNAALVINMMDELKNDGTTLDLLQLTKELDAPVYGISARRHEGLDLLLTQILTWQNKTAATDKIPSRSNPISTEKTFQKIDETMKKTVTRRTKTRDALTDKLDKILLHKIAGPFIFLGIMFLMFEALFTWSAPLADAIDSNLSRLADLVGPYIATDWLRSIITDGIIAGVGSVLVFVPQIAITFIFIGLLEMSGYLARGGFLVDRLMRTVGLEGRAFIPLISSFACAIPGILATRAVPNKRQRLISILVAPLITCSARLPVYALIIATFVPAKMIGGVFQLQALVLFSLFLVGGFGALIMAFIFDKLLPNKGRGTFFLELPRYRLPMARNIWYYASSRTMAFLKSAGTIIFCLSLGLWFLAYFPRPAEIENHFVQAASTIQTDTTLSASAKAQKLVDLDNEKAGTFLDQSFMGRTGHFIEPVLKPMGFDWRLGIGVIASFAAREVFVSTLGIVFNLGAGASETSIGLRSMLLAAKSPTNAPAYTLATAFSVLIFFAFACQCFSTLAVIRRETNSWRWPAVVFVYMTILAYAAATLTYQGLSHWF